VGNREIWKSGGWKSRNRVGNREIRKSRSGKTRNLGNVVHKIEKSGILDKLGGTFGPGLAQPAPKWALSGIDYPRAGQDRPGPADGPQDPKK